MHLEILDFEVLAIIITMLVDIVVGTIDHNFYLKDSNSGGAIKSLFGKLALAVFLIGILAVVHLGEYKGFGDLTQVENAIRSGADAVTILIIYFELTSVLAHVSNITGLDFSKIPMIKQELEQKQLTAHQFTKDVAKMKEEKNNDTSNK